MNHVCFKFVQRPGAPVGEITRPYAVVELQSETGAWFKDFMLADTGADVTSLPRGVCEILGKDLYKGERVEFISATNTVHVLYLHKVKARLGSNEFLMTVGFAETHTHPHLLGRRDLLDHFNMKFSKDDIWFEEIEP